MKLDDAFRDVQSVGLDTSPFIYFVERNPHRVDIMREIFRRITNGRFKAISSVITITEVLVLPFRQGNQKLVDSYNDLLFNGINFHLAAIDFAIAKTAAKLRAEHNLRTPDALQIATALENGCDAFLCNDKNLKRVDQLRVLVLDDLEL